MQQVKRTLLARVERDDDDVMVHEDENAHLWAVSYSDFLMALLAFFILFFSVDSKEKDQLILNLAKEFSIKTGTATGDASKPANGTAPARVPSSVFQALSNLNVKIDQEKNNLLINFPDDIFQVGRYSLRAEKMAVINTFLTLLKPYEGKVNIYFEGHSDNSPFVIHKNTVVTDNFVLSSLRANAALSLARDFGFSDKYMYIQAASSNLRNSRFLSVRIEPVEGESL